MMFCKLSTVLAFASYTTAHFVLNWPPTAGFDDDAEATAPCGGATVMVNSSSPHVNVDRFAALIQVAHPTGSFTFLATTDTSAPYNFTQLGQNITSSGMGTFCANYLHVPSAFAGKAGVIQVIDSSIDGVLYQCAPVNFVSGSNDTLGNSCTNSSGITVAYSGSQSASQSNSATPAATTASTSVSASKNMAGLATIAAAPLLGGLGMVAAGLML